jgi:hypothetical protein
MLRPATSAKAGDHLLDLAGQRPGDIEASPDGSGTVTVTRIQTSPT